MENFDQLALTWDNEPRRIERAKAVAGTIVNTIPDLIKKDGFEYGCGTGLLSLNLQPYLKSITLADNSDGMLSVLAQKIHKLKIENMKLLKLDLTTDQVPQLTFDLLYTLMTMHHIVDIERVIEAFYTMLNPQGYLCIADLAEEDGSFHGKNFLGHKGFNQEQLAKLLTGFGFHHISSKICYNVLKKADNGQEKIYPVFVMIAQKRP